MDLADYRYLVDWDNGPAQSPPVNPFLGTFDDISAYVLKAEWSYGNDSGQPGQTKAGGATITLDNSSSIFSSYNILSDIYGKILPGIRVRIQMKIGGGAWVTMWQGFLDSIQPLVGAMVTTSTAVLQAYGPLQQVSEDADVDIAMQTDVTTGAAMDLILDAVGYSATDRDVDTGHSTISRFWTRKGRTLELLRELEEEETGLLRETKDGKIQHEDRGHRALAPHTSVRSTYGTGVLRPWDLEQENPLVDICNSIEAKVRTFNKSELTRLVTIVDVANDQGGPPIAFANGETKIIDIEFPTPSSASQFLAVDDWGTVTVEINTNVGGTGTDLTNDPGVTMSRQELGRTLRCTFYNGSGSAGYFIRLFVDGTAIVEGDPLTVSAEDATSVSKYGKRRFSNPSQWLTDLDEAQDYCDHRIALAKDPHPALRFALKANYDATHLAEAQIIDVSDRIHITADLATFGLAIDTDFWVEHLKHTVDEARLHTVQVYCRAVVTHNWPASGTSYTAREVPEGVPDDLYCNSIDPEMHILFGCRAWKYNQNITGARFRAKYYATPVGSGDSVDLRTIAEGGDLVHDPGSGQYVVDTPFFANQYGAQYEFDSPVEGFWYFAFQFTSKAGDSVWSDGNKTPRYVKDWAKTDAAGASTGPPDDWWVEVIPDPSGRHAVIVKASRPKVNGQKIWRWVAQIKDITGGPWYKVSENTYVSNIFYGDIADSGYGDISHTSSNNNTRLTRGYSPYNGLHGRHAGDIVHLGDLILFDPRGGVWEEKECGWGTVDSIGGLRVGYDVDTATFFDVQGRFHNTVLTDLRCLVVLAPWGWTGAGYFGAEPNHGLYDRWYWDNGEHGDTTTQVFISDPIDVPADVPLGNIEGRVWFDNGYSTWDGGIITGACVGDGGNPSGASGLEILTNKDDPAIPVGQIAFQWNRETLNFRDIYTIAAWLSSSLPAQGPYDAERIGGSPVNIIETGMCTSIAGDKAIKCYDASSPPVPRVAASPPSPIAGKVFLMYTDDASPDSDLDGNVIASEDDDKIILTAPFIRSGEFSYAIVDCWWPSEGSSNLAYYQWDVKQVTFDSEKDVWRTPPVPAPSGTFYATLSNRNRYGLGTRLTTASPYTYVSQGCITIDMTGTTNADTNTDLGRIFKVDTDADYTLTNPTGEHYCGQTILWILLGDGVPTLDTKFRLMDGESISKSSGRDLLGAIYNSVSDQWDTFWKRGPEESSPP